MYWLFLREICLIWTAMDWADIYYRYSAWILWPVADRSRNGRRFRERNLLRMRPCISPFRPIPYRAESIRRWQKWHRDRGSNLFLRGFSRRLHSISGEQWTVYLSIGSLPLDRQAHETGCLPLCRVCSCGCKTTDWKSSFPGSLFGAPDRPIAACLTLLFYARGSYV